MKRLIISILTLCLAIPALAEVVSERKAYEAAVSFFGAGNQTRSSARPQLVWTGSAATRSPLAPPFYVFNNPDGGWVVIAGETTGRAILGWSSKGLFNPYNLSENVKAWFEEYANQISWARERNLPQSDASAKEWSDLLDGRVRRTPVPVKELSDIATWNQGSPYNQDCPRIDGGAVSYSSGTRTYTGCVATATAIVMRYYQHPAKGTGNVGGYKPYVAAAVSAEDSIAPVVNLTSDAAGYDWANMPLGTPSSNTEKAAVAKLMYHVGLAVEMRYGTGGSSSSQQMIHQALVEHFDYDPSMRIYSRVECNESAWLGMFKSELNANRPVIVAGRKSDGTGGHEFVATGYDSEDNIRINWGWGGSQNGYFALTYFKTTAGDSSGSDYRYSQTILIGIQPNNGGQVAYSLGFYSPGFYLVSDPDPAFPAKSFNVYARIYNRGGNAVSSTTRVNICDYTGVPAGTSSTSDKSTSLSPGYYITYSSWTCNLSNRTSPRLGDKLMVFYQNSAGEFVPITGQGNAYNNNIPLFDEPFIAVKDGGVYSEGEYFDFEIINTRATWSDMAVVWTFDGDTVELDAASHQASRKLTAGEHTVKAVLTINGETRTLVQVINVQ